MTEAEWLAGTEPELMLTHLRKPRFRGRSRKLRLWSVSLVRASWHLLNERGREIALASERYAEGRVTIHQVSAAAAAVTSGDLLGDWWWSAVLYLAYHSSYDPDWGAKVVSETLSDRLRGASEEGRAAARASHCRLLRELFSNPFRPASIDPAWLTPTVVSLAHASYEERILPSGELDPARLAVLADALEEAGCTEADILSHLRSAGPHVRGCWALDLILGKE